MHEERKRPWWAFDIPTILDDIPKAGGYVALLLIGTVGFVTGWVFGSADLASAKLVAQLLYGASGVILAYASVALGIVWWKHQLGIMATRSREINPDVSAAPLSST